MLPKVGMTACGEIVKDQYLMTLADQEVRQMRPDETSAPRDQISQMDLTDRQYFFY